MEANAVRRLTLFLLLGFGWDCHDGGDCVGELQSSYAFVIHYWSPIATNRRLRGEVVKLIRLAAVRFAGEMLQLNAEIDALSALPQDV